MSGGNDGSVYSFEILPDQLYLSFVKESMINNPVLSNYVLFTTDKSLVYTAFFADFGPLNLGLAYKFCQQLQEALRNRGSKRLLYRVSDHPHQRTNAAVLVCSYLVFVINMTAEDAYKPFIGMRDPFYPYRDAGFCINTFPITVLDCCRAMRRAVVMNHFSYRSFNMTNFFHLQKLQNGDISWIIPNKFIAFSGPLTKRRQIAPGTYTLGPEEYVPIFKRLGVSCVVRFNSKCYDRNVFIMNGIRHVDLYYVDGGNPTENILQAFLQLCEQETGAIAVHCKAGLGRTGTNIAAYMMKHYGYTARESIAWCRICRPGSIVGPQQQYLASIEQRMFQEGDAYRKRTSTPTVHETRSSRAQNQPDAAANRSALTTPMIIDSRGSGRGSGSAASAARAQSPAAEANGLFRRPTPSSARAVRGGSGGSRGRSSSSSREAQQQQQQQQYGNNNDTEAALGVADELARPATSGGALSPFHNDAGERSSGRSMGRTSPTNLARAATLTSSARLAQQRGSGSGSGSSGRTSSGERQLAADDEAAAVVAAAAAADSRTGAAWKTAESRKSNHAASYYRGVTNSKISTIDTGTELTSRPIGAQVSTEADSHSHDRLSMKSRPKTSSANVQRKGDLFDSNQPQNGDAAASGLFAKANSNGHSAFAQLRQSYQAERRRDSGGLATLGGAVYQHDARTQQQQQQQGKGAIAIPQSINAATVSQRPKTSGGLPTADSRKYAASAGSAGGGGYSHQPEVRLRTPSTGRRR